MSSFSAPGLYRNGEYLGQPEAIPDEEGLTIVGRIHHHGFARWMTDEEFAWHLDFMKSLRVSKFANLKARLARWLWLFNLAMWSVACFATGSAAAWRSCDRLILASGIAARSGETVEQGSTEGKSPAPEGDAQSQPGPSQ